MNIYDFTVKDQNGKEISLSQYRGKVILIINSATGCIFTQQYEALQKLYEEMKERDFIILDFPCNQFAGQAPGTGEEIHKYCKARYHVTFPQFDKVKVKGEDAEPLFKYLTSQMSFVGMGVTMNTLKLKLHQNQCYLKLKNQSFENAPELIQKGQESADKCLRQAEEQLDRRVEEKSSEIRWNFTKFLIDREGNVVARFEPPESIAVVRREVNRLLNGEKLSRKNHLGRKTEKLDSSTEKGLRKKRVRQSKGFFVGAYLVFILYEMLTTYYLKVDIDLAVVFRVLVISLPGAIIFTVAFYWARKYAEKSTEELSKALEEASAGNLSYRLTPMEGTPMARPFQDYNEMCKALQISMERMEEAVADADAANQAKSSFLSNMSHEIRTPLNAVLGMDEMIIRESSEEEIRNYAIDIKNAGRTLLSLINDILDISKIEAKKMEILPVEYDLSSVVNDLLNMTMQKARDKGLDLQVEVDPQMPHMLYGDEVRVKQVCLNILNNAVKYTEKGHIRMSFGYEKVGDEMDLLFSVKDTGQGIKEEDMARLFEPFARIEEKRNRNVEGTGLGISIVKNLLEMMGSQLEVDSIYGQGSDFHFRIRQGVRSEEAIGDFAESYRKVMSRQGEYQEAFRAPEAKILVVDDVDINLTVVKSFLKKTEMQIDTAMSGLQAIEKCKETKYDIVFLDHMMPDMDGIETLEHIRKECEINRKSPMVALTANAVSGAREVYLQAGFDGYLTKPIESLKLELLIMKLLPEQLLEKSDGKGNDRDTWSKTDSEGDAQLDSPIWEEEELNALAQIPGLDLVAGIQNTGSEEAYLSVARDFATAAESRANSISRYFALEDWKNYTIQVHALKSSARIVGDADLSAQAEALEALGHLAEADGSGVEQIELYTSKLLLSYRLLGESMSQVFEGAGEDKELIEESMLVEGLSAMEEALQVFDIDTVENIMSTLSDYTMPLAFTEEFRQLKVYLAEVQMEEMRILIHKYLEKKV